MVSVFGICDNHDSGAALVTDKKILLAINEERLNRRKNTDSFPKRSISHLEGKVNSPSFVAASFFTPIFFQKLIKNLFPRGVERSHFSIPFRLMFLYQTLIRRYGIFHLEIFLTHIYFFIKGGRLFKLKDHHHSHAASAYYTSGLKKGLVITIDGIGDGISVTVSIGEGKNLERIYCEYGDSAVGSYFSKWTEYLGFIPNENEGKVVGLSAYEKPDKGLIKYMERFLRFQGQGFNKINYVKKDRGYNDGVIKKSSKKEISSAVQKNFENQVTAFIDYWINRTGINDICLSGGAFANVKLNQRIHEISSVNSIYIFPNMGDGGLAVGCALAHICPEPFRLDDIFLGPKYSDSEIESALEKEKVKYRKIKDIEKKIAELVSENKIVARFFSRMEYGPRALGNRSILFRPDKEDLVKKLNKNLGRESFMPFAPAVNKEDFSKCFSNIKGAEYAARFMTLTFNAKNNFRKKCPYAVHIDGTSRVQIVEKEKNESFHNIISQFKRITKLPCVLNTSFNMHGEPIVNKIEDAIDTFKRSRTDFLALGDYLVTSKDLT